ncbi:AAA family ATPase [Agreia sp. PsM10]|uniref:AAA family ATPase n=1 Tax=Agreia sp. PsM10 TaxID=3030533 RepID=UPI00263AC8B8|nr:AAA family ATPase [Agreia sp. PsM10]MDN4640607.1 AAA family ATPase [Agreia sp. PsM10]
MLRRIDVNGTWRSLDRDFWPTTAPLGAQSIIYGHNGSGKSTFAELLLSLADDAPATQMIWEDEDKARLTVSEEDGSPSPSMAVFTRKWVDDNLADFLDGESASGIVTLGSEAIHAKEEEAQLVVEIAELRAAEAEANSQVIAAEKLADQLAADVQSQIVNQLRPFDYEYYTRNRFNLPKVKEELRKYGEVFPSANEHAAALVKLAEPSLKSIPVTLDPPSASVIGLDGVGALLGESPMRLAIDALEGNPPAQTWVEEGLSLHESRDDCLFCGKRFDDARRKELAEHFDASWLRLRTMANDLLRGVGFATNALEQWLFRLPDASELTTDLQRPYADAEENIQAAVRARISLLDELKAVLELKSSDPTTQTLGPDISLLSQRISIAAAAKAIVEHNDQVTRRVEYMAKSRGVVFGHIVGSQHANFTAAEGQATEAALRRTRSQNEARGAERRLEEVRAAQFTTKAMADTLTNDLSRVYGKHHLTVVVTDDGKSYVCRRGDAPATHLSEGERMTLSLLYFLRRLEDEQESGIERAQRIVVIDDPSSSLDREAIFATHQWLLDTLENFGQFIILTHDFGLLRLFIKSKGGKWGASNKATRMGDAHETRFPKVAFLEMYSAQDGEQRGTRIAALPPLLLSTTSEYAYLFAMVMAGVGDGPDSDRLFLLPNAARRVLEIFASYKAPHRTDFSEQLRSLVEAEEGSPFRDVYDFCNRYSHGEGSESVDVLDARSVQAQLRRAMEFLKAVDEQHFRRMCQAAKVDKQHLLLREPRAVPSGSPGER